jgi:hypothetical protein
MLKLNQLNEKNAVFSGKLGIKQLLGERVVT